MYEADTLVYGRKTYELMVPYWPDVAKTRQGSQPDVEFAEAFDAVENIVVFSRTLTIPEGQKGTLTQGSLTEEILKLKQQPGKNIFTGGVDLARQMAELGLIDEYHFVMHPTIAGKGVRMFDGIDLPQILRLKLVESVAFKSGCVALRYVKE
jgi:dihydrofolate reductase